MATLSIDIPNLVVDKLADAIIEKDGVNLEGQTSRRQYIKVHVVNYLKNIYTENQAIKAAEIKRIETKDSLGLT